MAFPVWVIGVILILLGSTGNNLGSNLVSLAHKKTADISAKESQKSKKSKSNKSNETSKTDSPKSDVEQDIGFAKEAEDAELIDEGVGGEEDEIVTLCSWRTGGKLIFVFGNLFTFASFGFGAQSLLAALESFQFFTNLFFVKFVHHQEITSRMMIATALILAGNVLVVIFAEHSAVLYTSDEMIEIYKTNNVYHGYLVVAFVCWVTTVYIYMTYYNSRMKDRVLLWNHTFIEPFCFSVASALVGTEAVKFSKCMAILINVTLEGTKNEFGYFFIYLNLVIWLFLVAYWLNRLDMGLKLYPPLFIIPVMQVFFVFFAILCGGLYFREFVHFSPIQFVGFCAGVTLILSGVYGLAPTDMQLQVPEVAEEPVGFFAGMTQMLSEVYGQAQTYMKWHVPESAEEPECDRTEHELSGQTDMETGKTDSNRTETTIPPKLSVDDDLNSVYDPANRNKPHSPPISRSASSLSIDNSRVLAVVMYDEPVDIQQDKGAEGNSAKDLAFGNLTIPKSMGTNSSPFAQRDKDIINKIQSNISGNNIVIETKEAGVSSDSHSNGARSPNATGKKNRKVVKRGSSVAPLNPLAPLRIAKDPIEGSTPEPVVATGGE
jgi:hypothetical protein